MSPPRRVVVTGMGAVSAAGGGVEPFWRACVEGRSMLRPITRFDAEPFGAPPTGVLPRETYRELVSRYSRGDAAGPVSTEPAAACALEAAGQALEQAGFAEASLPSPAGLALGTCLGGADAAFRWLLRTAADESNVARSMPISEGALSAPAARLAEAHRLRGPVLTLSTACASGTAAVALAADCIRRGEADVMLAGGVDLLSRFVVSGFWLLRALSSGPVRPFDLRRDGLALGEGAGILVLEEREAALGRGAVLQAELLGGGSSGDANHMTGPSPDGDGVVRAIEAALRHAGRTPDAVEFISAHGTGTPFNDRMESIAFGRVFGPRAARIPVDSIKPIIGHTLGAAGALEAILCVKVLRESIVPPTINYGVPDPECMLDYVPNVARSHEVRCALSCSSAFAGNNAAILLGRP